MSTLRELNRLRPLYTVPGDDLIGEVLVPAMVSCGSVRCMAGFFHSSAFRHLAPGLAAFVNGTDGAFQLLISPVLDDEDRAALRSATADPDEVLARAARTILDGAGLSPSALEQHTLDCLAYLLADRSALHQVRAYARRRDVPSESMAFQERRRRGRGARVEQCDYGGHAVQL